MYLSLTITFLILLALVITGIQNSVPLELKFAAWNLQRSLTVLVFYASLFGGAIVAVLTLPKLVKKCFQEKGHVGAEGVAAGSSRPSAAVP